MPGVGDTAALLRQSRAALRRGDAEAAQRLSQEAQDLLATANHKPDIPPLLPMGGAGSTQANSLTSAGGSHGVSGASTTANSIARPGNSGTSPPPAAIPGGRTIPVRDPVVAANGLNYMSNSKHTIGGNGNRPNAGIEPRNSLGLFERSIVGSDGNRYVRDAGGNLHRFAAPSSNTGFWHWNGGTGQGANSLRSQQVPIDVRCALRMPTKGW